MPDGIANDNGTRSVGITALILSNFKSAWVFMARFEGEVETQMITME
jgi:hypothetical protein